MKPRLEHRLGQTLRVLADLGERHVRVDDREARGLQIGLQRVEPPEVGPDGHDGEVGLVAEQRRGDHLVIAF